jgi:hypothetical protein
MPEWKELLNATGHQAPVSADGFRRSRPKESHARIASPLAGRLRHPERLFYKIGCDGKSGRGAAIGTMPNYAPRISAAGKW